MSKIIKGSTTGYVAGFMLSLLLTLTSYFLVSAHRHSSNPLLSHKFSITAIVVLAIVQLIVQLIFFLHLDRENKPRWNLMIAVFAAIVVLIIVLGSLWIMKNLNYHNPMPTQTDKKIIKDEGVHS